jgi:predicted ABC-type ATPase
MQKQPKLIVIAGPNGSGKTTITNLILKHEWMKNCIYINPDNITKDNFGDWNNPENVMQGAKFATALRDKCIEDKQSLIFETVFSSQEKIDFLIKANQAGFFIRLFFVGTDSPIINASRVAKRVLENGHDVPIQKIISRYYKSIANCIVANAIIDRLYVYDNSIENQNAHLLFRSSKGVFSKKYADINDWANPIFDSLEFLENT